MTDLDKIRRGAPCGDEFFNYPDVTCEYDCKHCDWNPKEHARRMAVGTFRKEVGFLRDEYGNAYKGVWVKKLVFRRK